MHTGNQHNRVKQKYKSGVDYESLYSGKERKIYLKLAKISQKTAHDADYIGDYS